MLSRFLVHVLCAAVSFAALPLALERVEPNPYYGIGVPDAPGGAALWYEANFDLGMALILWMALAAGIICLLPERWIVRAGWIPLAVFILGVLVPVTGSIAYVRNLA